MINDALYVDGKVAVFFYMPAPKAIKIGDHLIIFGCEHGVSLAFVDEGDVQPLLDHRGGCCGRNRQIFNLASQTQFSHWKNGKGGRQFSQKQ